MRLPRWRPSKRHPALGVLWFGLLVAAAFVYAMFQGGFVSWFLFYSIVPILLYTVAVALFPMHSLDVQRQVNREIFASGATMEVMVTVRRHSRFPLLFLTVDDRLPEGLAMHTDGGSDDNHAGARMIFFPGTKRELQFMYQVTPMPRGEYLLGDVIIKTGDVFGFLQKSKTVSIRQSILVYPRYEEIHNWVPFEHHEEGTHRGRQGFHYDLTSVGGIRDYSPGDRLSWLDWKSTARTNKLLTKEFERPLNKDMIICMDRSGEHYGKEGKLFERAVTVAASMVRFGLRRGSSVGFVSFGQEKVMIPLANSSDQQWRIFYHLAGARPDGKGDDSTLIAQAIRRYPLKANVLYITSEIDRGLFQLVDGLIQRKQKVDIFLVAGDRQHHSSTAKKAEEIGRLRLRGVDVHVIHDQDLNDALKAGVRYETS